MAEQRFQILYDIILVGKEGKPSQLS